MDKRRVENGDTVGSVKAAISKYGRKVNQDTTNAMSKSQKCTSDSEKKVSKAQELHIAKNKINQINENRKLAESVKSQVELELLKARTIVRELTSQIAESKTKARQQIKELQTLNKGKGAKDQITLGAIDHECIEVGRQLEVVKRELSKMKLDMGRALEEKSRAEKEEKAARLRLDSYTITAGKLRREIEEANEEEVLVELAQIQARKELETIESQRKEEADKFSLLVEETRKKIGVLREEIEKVKDLEDKLAVTNSDVDLLQNELKLIKEMDRRAERSNSKLKNSDLDLEDAKEELESIKGGGFQLMASMDIIRNELKHISKEKDQMEKLEQKNEKTIKNLNSKLLKAKDKLQVVGSSEEKTKSMLSSLSVALEELESEKEVAEKQRELIKEEIESIKTEIQKTESETDLTEERLRAAMEELEAIKSAEGKALKKLKVVVENVVRSRASKKKPTITISRFEYDYLNGCAVGAREMAEKKIAAANAWAEALKVSEREMNIKTELAKREVEQLRLKEEQGMNRVKELAGRQEMNRMKELVGRQEKKSVQARKSMRENGYNLTPVRQAKFRRSLGSPGTRLATTKKKRRTVLVGIGKYFASKQTENEKEVSFQGENED